MKTHFVDIKTLKRVVKWTIWKTWHLHRKLVNSVINDQSLVERLLHDQNVFKRLICTLTICISKQYVWDYVANCRIPLAYRTDLLIAEVVAWNVLDCKFNSREFLYGAFILYWCIPIVAFVCVSNKQQSIKTKPIVFTVVRIFKEVSEVGQTVKASHKTCDNCLEYGNKVNPTVEILSYPKTTFLVLT